MLDYIVLKTLVQVPEEGTSHFSEDLPLKVEFDGFGVSGPSWEYCLKRHPGRTDEFFRSRCRRVIRTGHKIQEFWASFVPSDRQRNLVKGVLLEPKEEPVDFSEEFDVPRYRYCNIRDLPPK